MTVLCFYHSKGIICRETVSIRNSVIFHFLFLSVFLWQYANIICFSKGITFRKLSNEPFQYEILSLFFSVSFKYARNCAEEKSMHTIICLSFSFCFVYVLIIFSFCYYFVTVCLICAFWCFCLYFFFAHWFFLIFIYVFI